MFFRSRVIVITSLLLAAFLLGFVNYTALRSQSVDDPETGVHLSAVEEADEGEEDLLHEQQDHDPDQIVICLDPGHTVGTGRGNIEHFGQTESMLVWELSMMLAEGLQAKGFEVYQTRDNPYEDVSIFERAERANALQPNLLLSLHTDLGGFSGYAFYVADKAGLHESRVGPRESLRKRSRQIAEILDERIGEVGPIQSLGVRSEEMTYFGHQTGGALPLSIFSQVPVTTLELGFLDSEVDGPFLVSEEGKRLWVDQLLDALDEDIFLERQASVLEMNDHGGE